MKAVPRGRLEALNELHYPRSSKVGKPPIGEPRMLRMYFLHVSNPTPFASHVIRRWSAHMDSFKG